MILTPDTPQVRYIYINDLVNELKNVGIGVSVGDEVCVC